RKHIFRAAIIFFHHIHWNPRWVRRSSNVAYHGRAVENRSKRSDLRIDRFHRLNRLGIVENAVLAELRREYMNEVHDPLRTMNKRHPHFRSNLRWRGSRAAIEWRGLDSVPNEFASAITPRGPGLQIVHTVRDQFQLSIVISDRIDIETDDVASSHGLRIVGGVTGARSASVIAGIGGSPSEVQKYGTRFIIGFDGIVGRYDCAWLHARPISAGSIRLSIVWFVDLLPSPNQGSLRRHQPDGVLGWDHWHFHFRKCTHVRCFQVPIKTDKHIHADILEFLGVSRTLQPGANRKEIRAG